MYFREPTCEADNFPSVSHATLMDAVDTSKPYLFYVLFRGFSFVRLIGPLLAFIDFTRSADDAPSERQSVADFPHNTLL